ncbi:hypothetical protein GCM10007423_29360 [Dyadobacter endophyticus]|uniref:TIGR02687 family protein n=1 Tax=Dyadobacter endophyticus TaxID=1749036 RepID=A0ABQ1YUS3_9BACT|nr:BREX-1 system phosphatase PglZ type A [Dyadobacter endophyticus]GGH36807.1 hypothetical protein GCM10007423_29360 [Dyadobacter endophyticus]
MSRIEESLYKLFDEHRLVFWYDEKSEMTEDFEQMQLQGIEKVHVQQNPFEIKYRLVKTEPEQKFLLYFSDPRPAYEDNWLLDLELAHHVLQTDQEALFLQEMELGYHFRALVTEHLEFFKSKDRRIKLKDLATANDTHEGIRYKMLSIVFGVFNYHLSSFVLAHTAAFSDGNERLDKELKRYNLEGVYWKEIGKIYGYQSDKPSIFEFLIEVFERNFSLGRVTAISKESRLLLSQWRDSIQFRGSYHVISQKISEELPIAEKLQNATLDEIADDELFKLTDLKIIHTLQKAVIEQTIAPDKLNGIIKRRENKFWYRELEELYQALWHGSDLIALVKKHADTKYATFEEGVKDYAQNLYKVDQSYRKFILHYRASNQNRVLSELYERVDKIYSNDWLLHYNNNWQQRVDELDAWPNQNLNSQQLFFKNQVKPFLDKKQRLFVIISDALRYECGQELTAKLLSENKHLASIEPLISSLPSYTQLGMASMLPVKNTLSVQANSDTVLVDGMSSSGIQGRSKVLETNADVRATAIQAEEFMAKNSGQEGREFVKNYDLIYIYHNVIDKRGDDKMSEDTVFEGVEDEIKFLIDLVKKIGNMNGQNILITADHGFIYQHHTIDESDFTASVHSGEVWKENRRFVFGKNLTGDKSTKAFTASQLNLRGDVMALIPKSINRLRIKGAGSRFVHGGATLQEIVVPLIRVSKTRENTTRQVDVDIIRSSDRITTNLLSISFIQSELVSESVLPRQIQAGIYSDDQEEELLSDLFKYHFDFAEGSERQREVKHKFVLSSKASSKYRNKLVSLILKEPIEGTVKWKKYNEHKFTINISFTNDFDDF